MARAPQTKGAGGGKKPTPKKGQAAKKATAAPAKDPGQPDSDTSSSDSAASRSSGFLTNNSTIDRTAPIAPPVARKSTPVRPSPGKTAATGTPAATPPARKATARKTMSKLGPKIPGGKFPKTPTGRVQKAPTPTKSPRKPHRYRPGTLALKEIRRYQKTTNNLIPRLPFARLIKEIATKYLYVKPFHLI